MFYEKFLELCNSRHIAPSTAAQEAGFSNAAATDWKNGCKPRKKNLQKLANYFGVPVEYFNGDPIAGIKKEPVAVVGDKLSIDYDNLTDDNEVKKLFQSVANNPQLLDLLRVLNQLDPDRVAALAKIVAPDK